MWHSCGPGSWQFIFSNQDDLNNARETAAASNNSTKASEALRLIAAVSHPDTGLPIPIPFRMASHVPVNALLLTAMLSARSPISSAAAQLANQSFNALQFYANRNVSNAVPDSSLFASFLGAVFASCGIAVLGARAATAATLRAVVGTRALSRASTAAALVPFVAAAAGKPLQIGAMRSDEFAGDGILVFDAPTNGEPVGRSTRAGAVAVATTTLTRILYLCPMIWMPSLQKTLESRLLPAHAGLGPRVALFVLHSAFTSAIVTPACIALFAQQASIRADALEEQFADRGSQLLYFNKGL